MPHVMVMVPTYNERENIEALIGKVLAQPLGAEIIVVDDNSPDGTGEAAEAWDAPPEHLVVSFHGIPTRYERREGRQYTRDCENTTAAFLEAIAWPLERSTLAYQSKFGPEPWLTPATAGVIEQLARNGVRRAAVVMPGFITDGLETIEEIGMRGRATFLAAGGEELLRVPAVEDHTSLIGSLVRLAGI